MASQTCIFRRSLKNQSTDFIQMCMAENGIDMNHRTLQALTRYDSHLLQKNLSKFIIFT